MTINISNNDIKLVMNEAKKASQASVSPYSKFSVGVAILTESGNIYRGTNLENSAYGSTICAEVMAVGATIIGMKDVEIETGKKSKAILIGVYSPNAKKVTPCGNCRQILYELNQEIELLYEDEKGEAKVYAKVKDLLPSAFGL